MYLSFEFKKLISMGRFILIVLLFLLPGYHAKSQCGFATGLGCPGTDYSNYGFNSSANASTLEYDNFISGFQSTIVRNTDGKFFIWGEQAAANGNGSRLIPTEINSTNFPGLTGTPIKAAMGSIGNQHQKVILTTDGLFVWGSRGILISTLITGNTNTFQKITVNGKSDGLPAGVSPANVKMMFGSAKLLAIVTCDGSVYVLSNGKMQNQGDGLDAHPESWAKVKIDDVGNPDLTKVIALRGNINTLMALTSDNEVYTWGYRSISGIESDYNPITRKYATKMTLPESTPIKMIGVASYDKAYDLGNATFKDEPTYYILYTNGKLYGMGNNELNQLGDFSNISSPSSSSRKWVQPFYPSITDPGLPGTVMANVRWISPNEHDPRWPAINVINNDGRLWNWGTNAGSMLGRTATAQGQNTNTAFNPGQPLGNSIFEPTTSQIQTAETGGLASIIIQECQANFGYAGYAIHGSKADGQDAGAGYPTFDFTTASIAVCGTNATPMINFAINPATDADGSLCKNQTVVLDGYPAGGTFSIESGPGIITNGNELTFDDGYTSGTVKVRYTLAATTCLVDYVEKDITFEVCGTYKVSGTVWFDDNSNALKDAAEIGTDGSINGLNPLWANLLDGSNKVVASVKVSANGVYLLPVTQNGTYSVQISNEMIGIGASIPNEAKVLPDGWIYTGNNQSNASVCAVPFCPEPGLISGIIVSGADIAGINFGLHGKYSVAGTVFHDSNGLNGGTPAVDGTPVYTAGSDYQLPAQPKLYIAAIGTDGKVIHYVSLKSNGTYNVSFPVNSSLLQLTTTKPVVGSSSVKSLPGGWTFVGESFGLNNNSGTGLNDGAGTGANGPLTKEDGEVNTSFLGVNTSITAANFGIEQTPVAEQKDYLNIDPVEFISSEDDPLSGYPSVPGYLYIQMTNPNIGPLTGTDPEDCAIANSCSTGSTFRIHTVYGHTKLYYDFGGMTGVQEIAPSGTPVEIAGFDPAKLVIYGEEGYGTSSSEIGFTYSIVDGAGVQSQIVSYSILTYKVLPVVIIQFDVVARENEVVLRWKTASEQNNDRFEVEKSTDGKTWVRVATVASKAKSGNSSQAIEYSVTDYAKVIGLTYYRLKQVDLDGRIQISGVRTVRAKEIASVSIFPNPATTSIKIKGLEGKSSVKMYDFSGRLVSSATVSDKEPNIDVSHLVKGVYNLIIAQENGFTNTIKLYKQ